MNLSDVDSSAITDSSTNSFTSERRQSKYYLRIINNQSLMSMTGETMTTENKLKSTDETTKATSKQNNQTSTVTAGMWLTIESL